MTNAEAIKWLELQRSVGIQWDDDSEEHRPFREEAEKRISEAYSMAIDALREQKPRVMTKSEAISYPEMQNAFDESDKPPLYVEYKTPQSYFVKWVSVENVYLWMNDFELNMDYGKEFRFWTSRPTDEQRRKEAWDA